MPGARTPCYRRVAYLVQKGFLTSTRLPSQSGMGSGKALLTIGPNARPVIAQMLGLSRSELARIRMDSPMFITHHLAISDTRLAFEIATDRSPLFALLDWTGDQDLHQTPLRVNDPKTGKQIILVPDSVFTLALPDGTEQGFVLEIDMGTVGPKRIREKLRGYLLAGTGPIPVLFVVPDQSRQALITKLALQEAQDLGKDPTIFWIAVKEDLRAETVLSHSIWHIVGGPEALALEELVGEPSEPFGDVFANAQTIDSHGGLQP